MTNMQEILYVSHDQLNMNRGVLKTAEPERHAVVLVESQRMVQGRNWHKERLFFLLSSARHFAEELRKSGFTVEYFQAETTVAGLQKARERFGPLPIRAAQPSSYRLSKSLTDFGVSFTENDFFLTSRELFASWADRQKSFVMENFYRAQRQRLNILMDGGKPVAGRWNFDAENRLPPPKDHAWPPYLEHDRDAIDQTVVEQLDFQPGSTWATTRSGALKQLENFVANHLRDFGPYEDAISSDNWALNHSLLSPYLNNGLLLPEEVIEPVLAAYARGDAPIESAEAFVRQVIGWREYINGMYWYLGEEYRDKNNLRAQLQLLPLYNDSSKTKMNCVRAVVEDVEERSWTHHIPRLMVLSNLALITGVNPQQFLEWMREQFIDAADWVMVPNVIGMAVHADGGILMTKPYAAGGAYLNRMTQHCKSCVYDPKKRVGDDACPFTTLYWDFLDRHKDEFIKNHRMSQQVNGLKRLSDLPELKIRAKEVIEGLSAGVV